MFKSRKKNVGGKKGISLDFDAEPDAQDAFSITDENNNIGDKENIIDEDNHYKDIGNKDFEDNQDYSINMDRQFISQLKKNRSQKTNIFSDRADITLENSSFFGGDSYGSHIDYEALKGIQYFSDLDQNQKEYLQQIVFAGKSRADGTHGGSDALEITAYEYDQYYPPKEEVPDNGISITTKIIDKRFAIPHMKINLDPNSSFKILTEPTSKFNIQQNQSRIKYVPVEIRENIYNRNSTDDIIGDSIIMSGEDFKNSMEEEFLERKMNQMIEEQSESKKSKLAI